MLDRERLKQWLRAGDGARFWPALAEAARGLREGGGLDELVALATLRRRALAQGLAAPAATPLAVALVGGYSAQPLATLLELLLWAEGLAPRLFLGEYDNYVAELLGGPALDAFAPEAIVVLPAARRCRYLGALTDDRPTVEAAARAQAAELLACCRAAHERTGAAIVLANFALPAYCGLGALRGRLAGSDWTFRKLVNLELGLGAPPFVRLCDVEFVAARLGGAAAEDARLWFDSKQPGSAALLVALAREAAHALAGLRRPTRKVLALDLDNTLWGGVIGDAGVDGIELGDTSPRGEAFKAFQAYLLSLQRRGVLLAVCSKNDHARALEPFEQHPEMLLTREHIVSFQANWEPKSANLERIAAELGLGLDSIAFVDDNPAEIELVRQLLPAVSTLCLGDDPAGFVAALADTRWFEPAALTSEDLARTAQYRAEARRQADAVAAPDLASYLRSLEMRATIRALDPADLPRTAQLINKSNQFNLTTRRRSEAELQALLGDPRFAGFTLRLEDKFGDHGLVVVVIGRIAEDDAARFEIDTWLMSCRVLQRGVEEETLAAIVRLAQARGCRTVRGRYLATARNQMVRDLLPRLGFTPLAVTAEVGEYEADCATWAPSPSAIQIVR